MMRAGEKVSSRDLTLYIRRHRGPERRLGLAVAGRLGGAVARNRIKRRLREYVRLGRGEMVEGFDLVVTVHRDLSDLDSETFKAIVRDLFKRARLFRRLPSEHEEELVHASG